VGARIEVYQRAFELSAADEYTLTYMENNKHIFIMADADAMIKALRAQARCVSAAALCSPACRATSLKPLYMAGGRWHLNCLPRALLGPHKREQAICASRAQTPYSHAA
jgi:hypothetical protein